MGAAWSAFAVVGGFAITQEQRGQEECVVCYRLSDGPQSGCIATRPGSNRPWEGSARAPRRRLPTDAFILSVEPGSSIVWMVPTGKALWTVDILEDNGGHSIAHGVCGSPLVTADWVIVSPTGNQ